MRITLVRHGQTIENANRIVQGQLDGTLSPLGKKQAKKVAVTLKDYNFDHIYGSDLGRCRQTTNEIIKFHPDTPVTYTSHIREMHFGDFQGLPSLEQKWDELEGSFETRRAPNGENGIELQKRVIDFVNTLLKKHPHESILIITHGGVMKALKANIEKIDYEKTMRSPLDNCEIWEYDIAKPITLRA